MATLLLRPDQDTYTVEEGEDVIRNELDGGVGRYRLDKAGASKTVTVQWSLNKPTQYNYLRAFFNGRVAKGGEPFETDLIVDDSDLQPYTCYFHPNTFKLVQQQGLSYVCQARLEVRPLQKTQEDYDLTLYLYEMYGDNYIAIVEEMQNLLEPIVNTQLDNVIDLP